MIFNFLVSSSNTVDSLYNENVFFPTASEMGASITKIGQFNILHNGITGHDFYLSQDSILLIFGYIRDKSIKWQHKSSNEALLKVIQSDFDNLSAVEFKKKYSGVYSIVGVNKDGVKLLTTFSAVHAVHYSVHNGETTVSNNMLWLQNVVQGNMYLPSVVQLLCSNFKEIIGEKSVIENVFRLEPNNLVTILGSRIVKEKLEFIPIQNSYKTIHEFAKYVWGNYNYEVELYCGNEAEVTLCLSGGLDSRLMLVSMNQFAKITAITHGDEDFYETEVAKRLATATGVPLIITPDTHHTFHTPNEMFEHFIHGGGAISEYVQISQVITEQKLPKKVILGDLFESLDARGTSFMSSRANRVNFVLNKLINRKVAIKMLNDENFEEWKISKQEFLIKQYKKGERYLSKTFKEYLNADPNLWSQLENDIDNFLEDFKNYKVNNIEDLNEIYGWLTKARLFHCRQLFSFSGQAQADNLTCTDEFLARILGVPLDFRVRKRLIYLIANTEKFKKVKKIPTVQVPFVPTNTPLIIREAILYLRYKIDTILLKQSMKRSGKVRTRVLKSLNAKFEHENPQALKNLVGWFSNDYYDKEFILQMFDDTKTGKTWPFTNMFYVSSAKSEYLMHKFFKPENKKIK
jgi:Asparagine synthase